MNRALLVFALALLVPAAHAATSWADLWATPDQRANKLLQNGDAHAAARTFVDPQRKAYAELQAGDYAAAARDYTQFSGSDDLYNRGNALAHAGDLAAAMKAYDAALARNPGNRDARHNRDLVAQAMRQKPPQPPQSPTANDRPADSSPKDQGKDGNDNKDGKDGKDGTNGKQAAQQGEQSSNADSSGKSPSQSGPQNTKTRQQSSGSAPAESAKASPGKSSGTIGSSGQASTEQNRQQQGNQSGQAPGKEQTAQSSKPNASGTAQPGRPGTAHALDDKLQAQQDAAAGVALAAGAQSNAKTSAAPARDQPNLTQARAPESEQRLAQEEWLRQIPDDPGGLLRRKLMIEHMLRQQKAQR